MSEKSAASTPLFDGSFDLGGLAENFFSEQSPINESFFKALPATASPLNPETESVSETETSITNTSVVTGAPVQLPIDFQEPTPNGDVVVNVSVAAPQSLPQNREGNVSAINEMPTGVVQRMLETGPYSEILRSAGLSLNTANISEIVSIKELVETQIPKIPSGLSLNNIFSSSPIRAVEDTIASLSRASNEGSALNEMVKAASQFTLNSDTPSNFLKAFGINIRPPKISELVSIPTRTALNETSTREKEALSSQTILESTSTRQNISDVVSATMSDLDVTRDRLQVPTESSPAKSATSFPESPSMSPSTTETITVRESTSESRTDVSPTGRLEETTQAPKMQSPPERPLNIDFGELEARLSRIEFLLSGPLEVKIVE